MPGPAKGVLVDVMIAALIVAGIRAALWGLDCIGGRIWYEPAEYFDKPGFVKNDKFINLGTMRTAVGKMKSD